MSTITEERLTRRELEILRMVFEGMTHREIGDALYISTRTVDYHVDNVYRRFDVHNVMQARNLLEQRGLL